MREHKLLEAFVGKEIRVYIGDCHKELDSCLCRIEEFLENINTKAFGGMHFSPLGIYPKGIQAQCHNDPQPKSLLLNIERLRAVCDN